MIIDIHTHTFPPRIASAALQKLQGKCHTALFSDGTEEGLHACETRAGADLAVVQPVATNPEKVSHLNDAVIETNRAFPESGILSFGGMHPACPYWEGELERIKAAGVRGIKLHPPYAGVDLDDPRSVAILRKCRELDLIVLIHSGWDVGVPGAEEALPGKIRRALDAAGPVRMIAAHMGGWKCWEETCRLLPETGVCLDTSFSLGEMNPAPDGHAWREEDLRLMGVEEFLRMVEAFGADRILFGSDSPWTDPAAEMKKIRKMPLDRDSLEKILGGNAARVLGIPEKEKEKA